MLDFVCVENHVQSSNPPLDSRSRVLHQLGFKYECALKHQVLLPACKRIGFLL